MSTAVLRPSVVVFREEQNFAWWVYALLVVMIASAGLATAWKIRASGLPNPHIWSLQVPLYLLVGLGLPTTLILGVLRMTTLVTPTSCFVWFGWVPTYRFAIAIDTVQRIEVVTYRPFLDCHGWGVRRGPDGERVLNARGDRGVRLVLNDGSRLLIGSQRPEDLAQALDNARRAAA